MPAKPNPAILKYLIKVEMPFGKYKGKLICDLPTYYLEWFYGVGFPNGKLGVLLETMFVIKTEGLSYLLEPLKEK
jgi:uncharacterized protein (DUF3820 family)